MSNPDLDKLLADEAAKVAAMTEEERSEYLDQIVAVQRANVKPYTGGERQAQAMMPIEIKNMRGPSLCPKCGAAPKIEKHPPSFGDDGSVVFSCCAITSVADDITGAQAHWDGAVVGYRAGVVAALRLPHRLGPSLDAHDGYFISARQIKALLNSEAKP